MRLIDIIKTLMNNYNKSRMMNNRYCIINNKEMKYNKTEQKKLS